MKRSLTLVFACAAAVLLVTASAAAAEYNTFVSCDEPAENPSPSYFCEVGEAPRAFFEVSEETAYEFCVEFPNEKTDCRKPKIVKPGIRYVDEIATDQVGFHAAYWFVGPENVGSFVFRMTARQTPPTEPVEIVPPVIVAPPPEPVVESPPPQGCLRSQGRVSTLKGKLGNATERKQRAKIRAALKGARASVKKTCSEG